MKPCETCFAAVGLRGRAGRLLAVVLALLAGDCAVQAADLLPVVNTWLAAQTNIQTWSADFTQTRSLKSLTQPLTATGHVWFAAPNRFRWELGQPPQTIAVRTTSELLILYPRLRRVEKFPLTGEQTGRWRDALALLETGFPRSRAQLEAQYNILSQTVEGDTCHLILEPQSASARRMMPRIQIDFDTKNFSLRGTELQFADGSTMRNDFRNPALNVPIDSKLFAPEIPAGYKVTEPLRRSPGP